MCSPLIKAWNYALDELSNIKVPGLPDFEEDRQIVFVRSEARYIATESCLQGSCKPDIVLVRWKAYMATREKQEAPFTDSHLSDVCCESGLDQPELDWRNLLSMVEVKRGGNTPEEMNEGFPDAMYTSGFEDVSAEPMAVEPLTPFPPTQPDAAREQRNTRSRQSFSPSALFASSLISVPIPMSARDEEFTPSIDGRRIMEKRRRMVYESDDDSRKRLKTGSDAESTPVSETKCGDPTDARVKQSLRVQSAMCAAHIISPSSSFKATNTINILLVGTWAGSSRGASTR